MNLASYLTLNIIMKSAVKMAPAIPKPVARAHKNTAGIDITEYYTAPR